MQNEMIERSKAGQAAQTVKVKPKWHMTVLHIVYYLILILFLLAAIVFRALNWFIIVYAALNLLMMLAALYSLLKERS